MESDKVDIHPRSLLGEQLSSTIEAVASHLSPHHSVVEFVTYDPADYETYPSVCQFPDEVKARFGFVGGERLVFDTRGNYLGRLTDELEEPQ